MACVSARAVAGIALVDEERGGFSIFLDAVMDDVRGLLRESPVVRSFFSVIDGFFPGLFI